MISPEKEASNASVPIKTMSIKKERRQKQIDLRFKTLRKKMLQVNDIFEVEQQRSKETAIIKNLIINVVNEAEQSIFKLWEHCLSFSFSYFTEKHIQILTSKLVKMSAKTKNHEEDISMLVWLIANWASTIHQLRLDHSQLVQILVLFLETTRNIKLHQYILFALHNLCCHNQLNLLLININAVQKVIKNYEITMNRQGDVSVFLKNLLMSLPQSFHFQDKILTSLTYFLKSTLPKCHQNNYLREDCIYLLQRLLCANNSQIKLSILSTLQQQVQKLVQPLQNKADCKIWTDIYELFAIVYEKPIDIHSRLYESSFCNQLWSITKNFLLTEQYSLFCQELTQIELFKDQLWIFLDKFLRISFTGIQTALEWLYDQCLFGEAADWEEKALKLLVETLPPYQSLQLIAAKLKQFQSINQPTTSMLCALEKILSSSSLQIIHFDREELYETIKLLQFDDRQQIASLAKSIKDLWSKKAQQSHQCRMEIEDESYFSKHQATAALAEDEPKKW